MTELLWAVLGASFVGSLHCAGMCGPLVTFYAGAEDRSRVSVHALYHGGRLITYAGLGAVAGSLGHFTEGAGVLVGVSNLAVAIASAVMVTWGGALLLNWFRQRGNAGPATLGGPFTELGRARGNTSSGLASRFRLAVYRLASRAKQEPPHVRATLLGACSGLLPCGWLYAFVITAAGTANPLHGAATMGVFWLGTVPVLLLVALGAGRLVSFLRPHVPVLSATALVVIGVVGVVGRAQLPLSSFSARSENTVSKPTGSGRLEPVTASVPDPAHPPGCPLHGGKP